MEDQVALIYAASSGFVNEVPTARLQSWASALIDFLHAQHPEITEAIAMSGQLSDEVKKQLEAALTEFNKSF
jgi:F-type H+-transporting ATPase subunit alpha